MNQPIVLITGSSTGLGRVLAQTLLEKGCIVFATMRDIAGKNAGQAAELQNLPKRDNGELHLLELDVTSDASVDAAVEKAISVKGKIDVLINNAGVGGSGYTEAFSTEQIQQIFDVNVLGVQRLLRAVLPSMRKQRSGLIINISSAMGRVVIPFSGAYTASKYALEGLAEGYRYELAPTGVDVVIVEPGGFASDYWTKLIPPQDNARTLSYGPLADTPDKVWSGISHAMQSEQAPDPRIVAEAVLQLIETPAGQRPLRTVVDPATGGAGPSAINHTTAEVQNQLLQSFGLKDLLSVKT